MEYKRSLMITGDAGKVLEQARNQFLSRGFRLGDLSDDQFAVTGPGMHSTHQDYLLGVSEARVAIQGKELTASAQLGGARKMQLFIWLFPIGLIAFLLLVFFLVFPAEGFRKSLYVLLLQMVIWLPIAAIWAPAIRRSTTRALDTLLENARQLGKSS